MTPAEETKRAREQEALDLADIAELKRTVAWERYWMRRLRAKRNGFENAFTRETMTHENREIVRQKILLMEEIEMILAVDEGSIKSAPAPQ